MKTVSLWLLSNIRGDSTTVSLRFRDVAEMVCDRTENICLLCGGEDRESVGANYIPARCSRCKLVYPGYMVNQCLKGK